MKLPTNGVAKEIRHYSGALLIFFFIIGIIITLIQFPVLESNKEIVMTLIGILSASSGIVISTIVGAKPDDVNALKQSLEKKEEYISHLTKAKDDYESMIIKLQKDMLKNQDDMFDRIMLKEAMDHDNKNNPKK
jgi:hypothetical protein|tara:strand:+ start:29 stop:430 length:402 start_codon:yes stop_codon:yes gene_type:complete